MAKFLIQENIGVTAKTVRLGAGTGAANYLTSIEAGKIVKLVGSSRFDLAAVGSQIEGVIVALETATLDDYTVGSIKDCGYLSVVFDGSEAAGTGAMAVGDYVVAGTGVAKGTALTAATGPKVRTATVQPSSATFVGTHTWRVVSLGTANTGAVGTVGVIERVNC